MKYTNYETNNLEFKELITKESKISWLKKVCAMANEISGGEIIIGVNDERDIVGVKDIHETIDLFTEQTNQCITPLVPFSINVENHKRNGSY